MRHLTDEQLVSYLDGELHGGEMARCAEHLRRCPACRQHAQQLAGVWELLEEVPEPEIPSGLADRIMAGVNAGAPTAGNPRTWFQRTQRMLVPVGVAAAIGLLVTFQTGQEPAPTPRTLPMMELVQERRAPEPGTAEIERVMQNRELLDTLYEYGELIEYFDVLQELDRLQNVQQAS